MPTSNASVSGYQVRALKVREMRDLNRHRHVHGHEDEVSFRIAAMSILKDGQSIGEEALANLEWPDFQALLKDVLRANGMQRTGEPEPEDDDKGGEQTPRQPAPVTPKPGEQQTPEQTPQVPTQPGQQPAPATPQASGNAQPGQTPAPPIPGTVTPEQPAPTPNPATTTPEPSTSPAPGAENSGTSNVTFAR